MRQNMFRSVNRKAAYEFMIRCSSNFATLALGNMCNRSVAAILITSMLLLVDLTTTRAQDAPATTTSGSAAVLIEGLPAARAGDATGSGDALVEGSTDVFIDGKPATVVGGLTIGGSATVFIVGKPLARSGAATTGRAAKQVAGCVGSGPRRPTPAGSSTFAPGYRHPRTAGRPPRRHPSG